MNDNHSAPAQRLEFEKHFGFYRDIPDHMTMLVAIDDRQIVMQKEQVQALRDWLNKLPEFK